MIKVDYSVHMTIGNELPDDVPAVVDPLPHVPTREEIERLEGVMRGYAQVEIEPVHHFADGLYAREITIPAGVLLTGKVHKTEESECPGMRSRRSSPQDQ